MTIRYYALKYIDKCPRRALFSYLESENRIEGVQQYYPLKKGYIKHKLYDYLMSRKDGGMPDYIPNRFKGRLESDVDVSELIDNLSKLIQAHSIEITDVHLPVDYRVAETTVKFSLDAEGAWEGDTAIFVLNTTTRFKRSQAKELVCIRSALEERGKQIDRLVVLKLGNGKYREVTKNGDRNKDGSLSKRGLKPWDTIERRMQEELSDKISIYNDIRENPENYNKPHFGGCGTCPYHNVGVEFNGDTIRCVG